MPKETEVILTMHMPLWNQIKCGIKKMDIRNTKPAATGNLRVYVYITGKVGVVGEFICKSIEEISTAEDYFRAEQLSFVAAKYIYQYSKFGNRKVYGWNISKVKEYENPIPLKEFGIKRPPQSWKYVSTENIK